MIQKEHKKAIHLLILYVLFIVLAIWLLTLSGQEADDDNWVCVQQVCSASEPGGEAWSAQNCGLINDSQTGSTVEACRVSINGVDQIVRRDAINLSAIESCTEYTCLQEVRVRNVNYTINPDELQ